MAGRFVHCAGRTKLTDDQVDVLRRADPQSPVDVFTALQWCELSNGHTGVPHHSEVTSVFEGDNWWVRWNDDVHELVTLDSCPVDWDPQDEIKSQPCGLFPDHPGRHGWAENDPDTCAHAGAGTPQQISEAVTFDGRYISVFEAPCFGCPARMVQVRILDPKQARPPQDLGASVSMWSFLSPELRI
ncbi:MULTISPECIES: hypothetical protein [Streptomyces]|uniref:Uncharacterized protein n=1 Tax=Streptomyces dengpaensis TaxID=2049881 RepID=A0ABN5IFP4_9ACTN|nr:MULTISPECIES: hypothetical protein [Streptomyces]AVH61761.1 hypothetical protein C4B68_40385 [Streptomyces dengpaensis]PIB05027.1 hypothetical protein B1C81_30400 [Streptomyces sp. HG99]